MKPSVPIQTVHLNVDAIDDDVVRLRGGYWRAVMEASSVNFGLKGDTEQEAIVAGYAAFLNSLTFPIQIVVRAVPIDVERYLTELELRTRRAQTVRLAELGRDHLAFIRRLARNRSLIERRFFLVVPAEGGEEAGQRKLMSLLPRGRGTKLDETAARKRLTFRCEETERQLGRCGLTLRRLKGAELVQLYFSCWCPETSRVQRIQNDLAQYTGLAVSRKEAA